jgi:hypothetical protein
MNLKDARDNYYFYSGKTSDIIRQLALAGIALIWLYKVDQGGQEKIPVELHDPVILIVLTLTLDLLQYAIATAIWGVYQRRKENSGTTAGIDFVAPPSINYPTIFLFWSKVVCVLSAYVILLQHIYTRIF